MWLGKIDRVSTWQELASNDGRDQLDSKIALGMSTILTSSIQKKIRVAEEALATQDEMLNGRQIAWFFFEYHKILGADKTLYDFQDLKNCRFKNGLENFWTDWGLMLLNLEQEYPEGIMESLFREQIEKDSSLKTERDRYDHEIFTGKA